MAKKVFGNTAKWVSGIKQQLEDINQENINTQYLRLEQIVLDPDNSRSIFLTLEDIINAPKLPKGDFDDITQSSFEQVVTEHFKNSSNSAKKISEYLDLAHFAASIKSPENLINPITGYMKDMKFHLVSGHRRTLAHHIMGASKISANILAQQPTALHQSLIQWGENQDREDLCLRDELKAISRIISSWEQENGKQIVLQQLISLLAMKRTKASWFLRLYKCNEPALLELIETGKMNSLEMAYKIACIKNKDAMAAVIKDFLTGNVSNAKEIKVSEVRPPDKESKLTTIGGKSGRRTNLKSPGIDISIKSKAGLELFNSIIEKLELARFKPELKKESEALWANIVNQYKEIVLTEEIYD